MPCVCLKRLKQEDSYCFEKHITKVLCGVKAQETAGSKCYKWQQNLQLKVLPSELISAFSNKARSSRTEETRRVGKKEVWRGDMKKIVSEAHESTMVMLPPP